MLRSKLITSKKTWESFISKSNQATFLQSWAWGEFHQSLGKQITRVGFYQNKKLTGIALLIKNKAKRGTYLECPGGPIIPYKSSYLTQVVRILKQIALDQKAIFIRIRPNQESSLKDLNNLKQAGFIKAPMHLHAESTLILDLKPTSEEIMAKMRKNTRYAIRKAIKEGVTITTSTNQEDIKDLYRLQLATVKRKGFVPFSEKYFLSQLQALKQDDHIKLFKATYKGELLAIAFIIFYQNEATYHYSGSSSKHRHIPASYLLQWEVIKQAKDRGLSSYNFWGYTDNPKHRFYGPSLFKKGFGGEEVNYLSAHDLPIKPRYYFTYIFETLRRKLRHL